VEDERIVALELEEKLASMGYGVVGNVGSGKEAVREVERLRPELVLMDIRLEGDMDGIEAARQIRAECDVPVVYVTAYADGPTLEQAKVTRPFGYIVKPFSESDLRSTIETALYAAEMERRLRKSEERYRTLVELMNDGLVLVSKEGEITYANDRMAEMCGHRTEEVTGLPATDLIDHTDREAFRTYLARRAAGESSVCELELNVGSGEKVTAIASANPILLRDGSFSGSIAVFTDITERKRIEEELRASEARFRAVFESADDWIFVKDLSLRYTHVNPSMLELLGVSHSEVIGRTDRDLFGSEEGQRLMELGRRVLQGQSVEFEHTLKGLGRSVACFCSMAPLRDASGQINGLCGIGRDVTERRERGRQLELVRPEASTEEYPSAAMSATLRQVRQAAGTDSIVLLMGESGAGKDYLAEILHESSPRAGGTFFTINCAALTPELAESELFGHEAGAFTGSMGRKRGLLELAEGGTLLLNEVSDLSPQLQAKLLTFLDTSSFARVGGEKNISVDARLVAATNRDLKKEVEAGNFRRDLFFRLNVVTIEVPPLRERIEDLPLLVESLIVPLAKRMGLRSIPEVDPEALDALARYDWPGNVRELRNVLERALIHGLGKKVTAVQLGLEKNAVAENEESSISFTLNVSEGDSITTELREAKRYMVTEALRKSRGSVKEAARILGLSRDAVNYLVKSLGIRKR